MLVARDRAASHDLVFKTFPADEARLTKHVWKGLISGFSTLHV